MARKAIVQDVGEFQIGQYVTAEEARRSLITLTGAGWLAQATVCNRGNGDLEFNRPPAAPKGL